MDSGNVLIIGDTHIPFCKKGYLEFCYEQKKRFSVSLVYHIGDIADFHSISAHSHNPDGFSPYNELQKTIEELRRWYELFPEVKVCIGNHDERISKAAWKYGLSEKYFKPLPEILEFPSGWKYGFDYYIYGVRIFHGMGYSGVSAHKSAAVENQCSIAMGHLHSNAGTWYTANERNIVFGLAVGSGIDRDSYAFNYGRDFRRKPILGCGIIYDGGRDAQFVPMQL